MKKVLILLYFLALFMVVLQHCDFDNTAESLLNKKHTIFRRHTSTYQLQLDHHSTRIADAVQQSKRGKRGDNPGQGFLTATQLDSLQEWQLQ